MLKGSMTTEQETFVEEWQSVTPITNWIYRQDARGDLVPESVAGPRKFKLTTMDRILTQDRILHPKDDPFTNGCFRPITVPDEVNIETNPNALSDEDIQRIFKASDVAWDEYMKVIDSPATLRRMLELAEGEDGLTVKRLRDMESRLSEVGGGRRNATQKDEETYRKLGGDL